MKKIPLRKMFKKKQKWIIFLQNGKKKTVWAKSKYDAKQNGLTTNELIIGYTKIEHGGEEK